MTAASFTQGRGSAEAPQVLERSQVFMVRGTRLIKRRRICVVIWDVVVVVMVMVIKVRRK